MNEEKDIKKRLEDSLIEFVEHATSKKATPAEIEALPAVANVLARIIYPNY